MCALAAAAAAHASGYIANGNALVDTALGRASSIIQRGEGVEWKGKGEIKGVWGSLCYFAV